MKFSILITTKDRADKMINCLSSIFRQTSNIVYEILIVDQSKTEILRKKINKLKYKYKSFGRSIKYYKVDFIGRSKGLNYIYNKSKYDIVIVIDDDCIVNRNWINNIQKIYVDNSKISGVIGAVLPYKHLSHQDEFCPCLFLNKKKKVFTRPCYHKFNLGFGSNFSVKKNVLKNSIFLKEWLGPGSIGMAADDAELPLRLLLQGKKLYYSPQVKIYHDNWLSNEDFKKRELGYSCGEIACYGYFWVQGKKFARRVVVKNFDEVSDQLLESLRLIVSFKKIGVRLLLFNIKKLFYLVRGLFVGLYFSLKDPINY